MTRSEFMMAEILTEHAARKLAETLQNPTRGIHAQTVWQGPGNRWRVRVVINRAEQPESEEIATIQARLREIVEENARNGLED